MGFLSPTGLISLVFLAALVALYLRERHQRQLEVSSLLLWQVVREETERSRFRPNLLFLLQAALLAVLAFALGRPYWTEQAAPVAIGRAVFVFDTSASMQAIEKGERRFDQARRKASEVLSGLDRGVEVMVVAVEAHPRVALAFTRDHSALSRALEALEPGDGPSRLSLGIQLARSMAGPSQQSLQIYVFTDLPRAELVLAPVRGERLRTFRFGQSDDNVAIAALRVYQSPFQDAGEARGYALVKNYSNREKELELHVSLAARPLVSETLRLK
ncbi:MAG: VWA domain-containing protein, partial [Candidatus Binatia bacterium]